MERLLDVVIRLLGVLSKLGRKWRSKTEFMRSGTNDGR